VIKLIIVIDKNEFDKSILKKARSQANPKMLKQACFN
jgi:hypothetical protein